MPGETNLSLLLKSIQPILQEGEYVFCSIDRQNLPFFMADAIGIFQEEEGTTIILSRNRADADKLNYSSVFRMITLSVHSSLDAVGFLAAIATKLAEHRISVNPVSAYYHDHLFVPTSRALEVMDLLKEFSEK
jgi:hypothetical protein